MHSIAKKALIGLGAGVSVAAIVIAGPAGVASAKSLITGADIKNGTIHRADLATGLVGALKGQKGDTGKTGANGKNGAAGADGKDAMTGAYYSVSFYDVGNTNPGAIATTACKVPTDTAISGGAQVLGIGDTDGEIEAANNRNTPVSSSFPGRMDWDKHRPMANRLDGWIVQFGGTTLAPEKVKVWALCVPGMTVPVEQTYTQSS